MQNISTLSNGYYTNRKYGRRNIKVQPKPQSLPITYSMLPTDFVTKHCTYNIQDRRRGIIMFPFQRFQTNKFSSQGVKVRPFLNNDH